MAPRPLELQLTLNAALNAAEELRAHLDGRKTLDPESLEVKRTLVQVASFRSLYFFAKVVLGMAKMTSTTHERWADDLQSKFRGGTQLFMRLKPRGTFKTSLYGEAFCLWLWAVVSPDIRIFYSSANQSLLDEISAHMRSYLQPGTLYNLVFDIECEADEKNTQNVINVTGRDKSVKGFSLTFRPAGGSTNGLHPNVIICDDPCDKDDRESSAVRASKKRWHESLVPLLVPMKLANGFEVRVMVDIGTRWHMDDVFASLLAKEDSQYDVDIESAYNSDGTPRFPELLPETELKRLRSQISSIFFACQYLNDPLPEGERIFEESQLHFIRPDQYDVTQGPVYCFFDPARGKAGDCFPAVVWFVVVKGVPILHRAIDKRVQLAALIPLIAACNKELKTKYMGFETNGSTLLLETLVAAHKAIDYHCFIEEITESRNKFERIAAMQPDLYGGKVLFRTDWKVQYPEAMNQLVYYPAWPFCDYPDIIEKAVSYFAAYPPAQVLAHVRRQAQARSTMAGAVSARGAW